MSRQENRAPSPEARLSSLAPSGQGLKRQTRHLLLAVAVFSALLLIRPLSRLFLQVAMGLLLSLAARPVAALYEKRLPRAISCLMAILTLLLFAAGVIALFVPPLVKQLRTAAEVIPTILAWGERVWTQLQQHPLLSSLTASAPDMGMLLSRAGEWLTGRLPVLVRGIAGTVDKLSTAFIAPVLAYYFLKDRELFCYQISLLIPLRHRKRMLEAIRDMRRETGAYIRGQLLIALIVGALTGLGLFLIGVPAWMVLGALMGICEVIPYIGPIIGGIPIVLFALSKSPATFLWALLLTLGVQQLEGMVIAPRMMSGATGLHPVYVLLLLTAGSMLFGLWGLLFSLPVFLCLRSTARIFLSGAKAD